MKPWAKKFYKSKAWQDCRDAYIKSVFGLCERCGAGAKIIHHKTELTPENINDPNITLNWENLEAVCQDCHNTIHHGGGCTAEGLMFDDSGKLIKVGESV